MKKTFELKLINNVETAANCAKNLVKLRRKHHPFKNLLEQTLYKHYYLIIPIWSKNLVSRRKERYTFETYYSSEMTKLKRYYYDICYLRLKN